MRRLVVVIAMVALATGCAAPNDSTPAQRPGGADPLLARYQLDGRPTAEVIDRLDRLAVKDRPTDLKASVRPDRLVVSSGGREVELAIPDDRFYLSVAPYVNRTHECFYHSLTTCRGELGAVEVAVTLVDETNGTVLFSGTGTTFDNGFLGFWLPRGIKGTLRMTYGGKVGEVKIATDAAAPTCLTTLRLT